MTCSCPKCNAQSEFDPTDILSEGSFNKCTECGTNFVIRKESFARRALHKSDAISCAECGNTPGPSIYCQSCHAIYPDFLVIEASSAAKKQLGKILATLNVLKHLKIGGAAQPSFESYAPAQSKPGKSVGLPGPAQLFAVLVVVLLLAGGGGYYWHQDKLATKYTQRYVRALISIKMSRDLDVKVSDRLAAVMKTGGSPALTADEKETSKLAKTDVDLVMKKIDNVPDKFTASNDSLKKLYDTYAQLHATVISPSGSADLYSGAVKKIDDDFRKTSRELKSGLPERISAQVAESGKKFKALQDL